MGSVLMGPSIWTLVVCCCTLTALSSSDGDSSASNAPPTWYVSTDGSDDSGCGSQADSACRTLEHVLADGDGQDGGKVYLSTTRDQTTAFVDCTNLTISTSGRLELLGHGLRPQLGCQVRSSQRFTLRVTSDNRGLALLVLRNLFFINVDVELDGIHLDLKDCEFENANLHLLNAREGNVAMTADITRGSWRGHVDCEQEDSCEPSSGVFADGNITRLHISHTQFLQHRINISFASDADLLFDHIHVSNSPDVMPMMGGIFVKLSMYAKQTSVILRNSILENQYNWHPAASVMNLFMSAFLVRLLQPGYVFPPNNITIIVQNSTFYNNERALTFQGPMENLLVIDSVFDSNIAMHAGGALLLLTHENKTIIIRNSTFNNNAAGHIRVNNVKPRGEYFLLSGDEVRVNSNCCKGAITLVGKGGAARIQRGKMILEHCSFFNNTARVLGGTLFVDREGVLDIRTSKFANTPDHGKASQQGDVIYSNGRVQMNGGHLLVQSTSNHISLLQHSGDHWSIAVYDVTIECPIGHRLRVMNTSAYRIQPEMGLQRSYMLDQLSYFCESCPRQKYSTDQGYLSYKLDHGVYTYFTLMINGENPETTFHGLYEYHDIECKDCPYGANCDVTLRPIPNFWGYDKSGNITFQLCPKGYCCPKAPCEAYNSCAESRTGVLCGTCIDGYSEALFSPKCVPDETCGPIWIWPFAFGTGVLYALLLFFQKDIRDFIFTNSGVMECHGALCHKTQTERPPTDYQVCKTNTVPQEEGDHCRQSALGNEFVTDYGCSATNAKLTGGDIKLDSVAGKDPDEEFMKPLNSDSAVCNGTAKEQEQEQEQEAKELQPPAQKTDLGAIMLIIVLYYFQDAMLFQVKTVFAEPETKTRSTLRAMLLGLFQFRLEVAHFVDNVCLLPGLSPSQKLLALTVLVPYVLVLFGFLYIIKAVTTCASCKSSNTETEAQQNVFMTRLSTGFMLSLLFMYQRLAKSAFTLLNCVPVGDHNILFIEGAVKCYEVWQYGVMAYALGSIIPFCAVLLLGPGLLREGKVGLPCFFLACLIPLPFVLYWTGLRLCEKRKNACKDFTMSPQMNAVVTVLQGPFKDLNNRFLGPVCWAGVVLFRRLILILLYTFINHSLVRVISMLMTCFLILLHHVHVQPYKDNMVNIAGSASVSALMLVGGINLVRAGFETAEYIPQGPNEKLIYVMRETESVLMLWFPLVVMSIILLALVTKICYSIVKAIWSCVHG